jgi:hypothetical protein
MDYVAGPALGNGHLQGVQDELRPEVVGHGPSDDPAAEGVEHDGDVEEAGSSRYVGDIRHPELVRGGGGEVAVDEVGSRTRLPVPPRRNRATAPMAGPDEAGLAHQPGNGGYPLHMCNGTRVCGNAARPARAGRRRCAARHRSRASRDGRCGSASAGQRPPRVAPRSAGRPRHSTRPSTRRGYAPSP